METTLSKGNEFETLVYEILYHTIPQSIEFYYGSGDRGRDIILQYNIHGQNKQVIVECKNYHGTVTQKDVVNSINWAVANRPDLYYLWISSHLSPSTKDYIKKIAVQYNLAILYEENESIQKYKEALKSGENVVFTRLKSKIQDVIYKNSELFNGLEYNSKILISNHYLLDRQEERKILKKSTITNFYLTGTSGIGKTQLAKVIAKYYFDRKEKIFWHRVISKNDNEYQVKCFLEAMGTFFKANFNDNYLYEYINSHGSYLTNQLINILNSMFNAHKTIIFIDDIHKCSLDNYAFLELLYQLVQNDNCRCYFLGWFNIFDISKIDLFNQINYIEIKPLDDQYIKKIAKHSNTKLSDDLLNLVVEKSQGFPGLAEVIPNATELIYIDNLEQTFTNLLEYLADDEVEILIALVISRVALPKNILFNNYYEACRQLERRKIIKTEGNTLVLHDRFKDLIQKSYNLKNPNSFILLEKCSKQETVILIDLLYTYLSYEMKNEITNILNQYFDILISKGFDSMLFDFIRKMEEQEPVNSIDLIIKKMILIERKAEYDMLGMYLEITEKMIDKENPHYFMRQYLKYRYFYFNCMFDKMFNDFWSDFNNIQMYPKDIYLQILFIIGRTFYIQGDMLSATEIYSYIFNEAFQNTLSNLCIKALHRICIIEEKLGMYESAKKTLDKLMKSKYFISSKRQAFANYRLAKCYLGLNDITSAHEKNNKSIEIKESLNAQRGLIFSYKLRAQIYFAEQDIDSALLWGNQAYTLATNQNLNKEVVATGILLAKIYLLKKENKKAEEIIENCTDFARAYALVYRLQILDEICNQYNLVRLHNIITAELESASLLLKKEQADYSKFLFPVISKSIQSDKIEELFTGHNSLSQKLLYIL